MSDTGPSRAVEHGEHAVGDLGRGERLGDEEVLDVGVLDAAQQDGDAAVEGAARAADLLVVGDGGARRLEVDDEAEVGLVVTHPERGGGDERLDLVALQPAFRLDPGVAVEAAEVAVDVEAAVDEPFGDVLGVAHREAVDDPRAGELLERRGEPGQPLGLAVQPQRAEGEAVATERAAERGELGAELFTDVGDDPIVRRRRASEHRHGGGVEPVDDLADPAVVGPEVVTPVGDAVDLVDDHQPGSRTDQRHRQVGELRIGEPLGRHEDEVDVVRRDVGGELVDRRRRRAVHRHRAQPEPGRRVDLVAHQREQRRDQQRRPEPGVAQQPGREEVHRALAPSGALDDEDTGPVAHQGFDGFTLMRSELRVGSPGQPTQGVEQFVGLTRLTHRGPFCRGGVRLLRTPDGVSLGRHRATSGSLR